ncbi:hypothetical protein [Streptomyces sp. NPDC001422]|uniref:hypothetical protein n=1 Tax=Streptomyces sp. NPDC001422 TaxID=3364575 RepID=UPI0036B4CAD7
MSTPADRIAGHLTAAITAIGQELAAVTDPVQREALARDVIDRLLPQATQDAKAMRAEPVAELRDGRTLREVGELLKLTPARVDQILKAGRAAK